MDLPPSPRLRADAQGRMRVDGDQEALHDLLRGTEGDAADAREQVRTLIIQNVDHIPADDWAVVRNLEELSIDADGNTLTEFPRELHASALPALQRLTLRCQNNHEGEQRWACPVLVGSFQQLNTIIVQGLAMGEDAIAALLQRSLTILHLVWNGIGTEGCRHLAQAFQQQQQEERASPDLTHLHLRSNKIGDEGCRHLAEALRQRASRTLTHLSLYYNGIGADGCYHLVQALEQSACRGLIHLDLGENKIAVRGCGYLAEALQKRVCPDLVRLDLQKNGIGAEGCKYLAQALRTEDVCPNLEHLNLQGNRIGEVGCKQLVLCLRALARPTLASLHLGQNDIGINGCKALEVALRGGACPGLAHLSVEWNKIGSKGCTALARALRGNVCPGLTHLDLSLNDVDDEGCTALAGALRGNVCPGLTHLDLNFNDAGDGGCAALARAFYEHACPNLILLNLERNSINEQGFTTLVRGLGEHARPSLTHLKLGRNGRLAAGCSALANALERNAWPNLAHLSLGGNYIGEQGCVDLARALRNVHRPRLTYLHLGWAGIGAGGCKALAQALKEGACPNLTQLILGGNGIGDAGCVDVANGLEGCPRLQELDLQDNEIERLADGLAGLGSLTGLYVSGNRISQIQKELYDLVLQLRVFKADFNPLDFPPLEVYDQGPDTLKRFLRACNGQAPKGLRTVRVMLVGDKMHGKTTLRRSLMAGGPCVKVENHERTHALEIHDWVIKWPGSWLLGWVGEPPLTIKLWDFAGHEVYYATHRTFFSRLCIYVLVVRIEVDDDKMQKVITTSIDWLMSICKVVLGGAQILVVGTFPHDERAENEQALLRNLRKLEDRLAWSDEERVRIWNAKYAPEDATSNKAAPAIIHKAMWVDCYPKSRDHNLGPVAAKLRELAEEMVRRKQLFPAAYVETLEAHRELCRAPNAGVASLEAFRARVQGADNGVARDAVMRDALEFASDVGILQYYPRIDREIVFIDPLFLVQAFGVLIYDKEAFSHYVKGANTGREGGREVDRIGVSHMKCDGANINMPIAMINPGALCFSSSSSSSSSSSLSI